MNLSAGTLSMPGVGVALAPFIWRVFALLGGSGTGSTVLPDVRRGWKARSFC